MLSASFRITARRCAIIASTSSFTPTEISCGFRQPMQILVNVRHVSTAKEIFGLTQEILNISDLPPVPLPPPPLPSIEDLALSGQSVLNELGLLSWWKPSSYFRLALEGLHNHFDLPWWATIMCATVILRLSLIIVPIMSQRLIAKQSMYRKELAEFQERISDARREGNNLLMQQILLEQRDFMVSKDIKIGRQFLVTLANGAVFGTQFFAIREMVNANFPGWNTGGILWFTNLCAVDPYWALPLLSAITMGIVFRVSAVFKS
ncbi:hypothetical protein AB6A40_010977 [Gnathostoma spinigerum]|uniref:Uncharacterized protein n=1 Tax=Gnathostoma spinigerum TaxID=75299 RepID=A0ABD6F2R7_9BILA